mmetsp:Transcript_17059/g.40968  ORF Transcript_17059/g.40968 Transcript_17059/m.40968 type:complete len:210 (-) Transcript_17059:313-942(-)
MGVGGVEVDGVARIEDVRQEGHREQQMAAARTQIAHKQQPTSAKHIYSAHRQQDTEQLHEPYPEASPKPPQRPHTSKPQNVLTQRKHHRTECQVPRHSTADGHEHLLPVPPNLSPLQRHPLHPAALLVGAQGRPLLPGVGGFVLGSAERLIRTIGADRTRVEEFVAVTLAADGSHLLVDVGCAPHSQLPHHLPGSFLAIPKHQPSGAFR